MKSSMRALPKAPFDGGGIIIELCEKPELIITDWLIFVVTSHQYCWIYQLSNKYITSLMYFILIYLRQFVL